jgi:carotenoid cleavage dioxygenase
MAIRPAFPDTVHYRGLNTPTHLEASARDLYVEGEIPPEIEGAFFRAVHDPQFPPKFADEVVLSRDGMISKIEFRDGRVNTAIRYVLTERFLAERAAGKALFGKYRNPFTDDPSVAGMERTVANTTPYFHAGRLFMSKEDGLPYRIDPDTLNTVGKWDYRGKLRSQTLTAHPKIDAHTGELFLFGYQAAGLASATVSYCVIGPDGELLSEEWFETPYASMQHDFAITQTHVVFLVYPTKPDLEGMMKGGPHWIHHQDEDSWIGVMPRDGKVEDLVWFRGPKGVHSFHVMNAFDDGTKVHIDQCLFNTCFFDFVMKPSGIDMPVEGALTRWTVDLADVASGVRSEAIGPFCEMPIVPAADVGHPYQRGWYLTVDPAKMTAIANGPAEIWFNCLQRISFPGREIQSLSQGPGVGFNEPFHIASPDPAHGGWLVMMTDHVVAENVYRQEVWMLEADAIDKGPIARVHMPFRSCGQVHGWWVRRDALDQARND